MSFLEIYRGVITGLFGALLFGVGTSVYRLTSEEIDVIPMNFIRTILGFLFFLVLAILFQDIHKILALSLSIVLILILSVIFNVVIGDTAYFEAQKELGTTSALAISMTFPLFTFILSLIFLGTRFEYKVIISIILIPFI